MNDISVEVDNTDAESCLVLADMFYYATTELKLYIVTTLTRAIDIALGEIYTGVFTTFDALLNRLLPERANLCNIGGKPAGSCTAALFLKAFVDDRQWIDRNPPSDGLTLILLGLRRSSEKIVSPTEYQAYPFDISTIAETDPLKLDWLGRDDRAAQVGYDATLRPFVMLNEPFEAMLVASDTAHSKVYI
ncbi:hypothetical protein EDB19DRAFT_2044172 [Suillus lakei]|nr:hypothetical protein EDB19DRAFT_2044172 [Suillus lakei]